MTDSSPLTTPVHSEAESSDSDHDTRRGPRADAGEGEPSGEDLDATANRDYRAIPALDTYENEGLDADEYPEMGLTARLDAENEIRRRRNAARGVMDLEWGFDDEATFLRRQREQLRRQQRGQDAVDLDELLKPDADNPVELQEQSGVLSQYLERPEIRREIGRRFQDFLVRFQLETGEKIYVTRIRNMGSRNLSSFDVEFPHLAAGCELIALWLGDAPAQVLPILDEAAFQLVVTGFFPEYARIAPEIHVRIAGLTITDDIRDLRQVHLNVLVRTVGVVTKATTVLPQLRIVKWRCGRCNSSVGPFPVTDDRPVPPTFCPVCNARTGFRVDTAETVYRNYQRITIQEPPGAVPAGRLPRTKDVILQGDLTDCCRPGEQIDVTGIYKHVMEVRRQGFPVFATMVEANHISRSSDQFSIGAPTEEEKRTIIELSQRPDIAKLIFDSIAPSIFGHDDIKAAIGLALFGGRRKDLAGRHCVRGDINVLLLGDPATAKSQFLKCAEGIAPRAVFTTGKGASAVGLTASVHKDQATGEWTLEGGALVLADGGVCLIDEFDKMSEKDRTSIHEAMEQQSISISKAGIVTSLLARCSVIAACNPVHGRYDGSLSFGHNAGLSDPILSRFDVLCVVRDIVDPITDARLADAVIEAHRRRPLEKVLKEEILRKYIAYARTWCNPKLTEGDNRKIVSVYAELRKESQGGGGSPITVRHLESIIRLAEAHARLHLRSTVEERDVNFAIALMLRSFVSTQKYADKKAFERKFGKYLSEGRDRNDLLMHVIHTMVIERASFYRLRRDPGETERVIRISKADFEARAREVGVQSFHEFYASDKFRNDFTETETEIIRET